MSWPDGFEGNLRLEGRARDIFTDREGGAPKLVVEDGLIAAVARDKTLLSLATTPDRPELQSLVGGNALKGFRRTLTSILEKYPGSERPLATIMDDMAAAALISGWAMTLWPGSPIFNLENSDESRKRMEGTCIGYRPGSQALIGRINRPSPIKAPPVIDEADPEGWHAFASMPPVEMRRARRIDLWREEDGLLHIDAMFQDSAPGPDGVRLAVHDYAVFATIDPADWVIRTLEANPRILPYPTDCPAAADNVHRIIGVPLDELRHRVLDELRSISGCTHLNDAIRALAGVRALNEELEDLLDSSDPPVASS